jgi:hypothetical protein
VPAKQGRKNMEVRAGNLNSAALLQDVLCLEREYIFHELFAVDVALASLF